MKYRFIQIAAKPFRHLAILLFCLTTLAQNAWAVTKTFDGGAATANWSDAANWDSDALPVDGDDIVIPNTFNTTVDAGFTVVIQSLTIDNGGSVTLGTILTVDGSDVTVDGDLTLGSNTLQVYTGNITVNATTGTLSGDTGKLYMEAASNRSFDVGSGVTLGTLEVNGAGAANRTFSLSGSGSLTINEEVILTGKGLLSPGSVTLSYSTAKLTYNGSDKTVGGEWSNPGNIEIKQNTVTLNSTKTFSGQLKLNGGNLTIGGSGNLTVDGTLEIASGTVTNSGSLSYGASSLLKYSGSGNYTIGAEWTGTVIPKSVEVSIGAGNTLSLATAANRTVNKNLALTSGILNLGTFSITVLGDISGDVSGSGTIADATTLVMGDDSTPGNSTQDQTFTGLVNLNKMIVNKTGGTNDLVTVSGTINFSANGTLTIKNGDLKLSGGEGRFGGSNLATLTLEIQSGGTLETGGQSLTGIGTTSGGITAGSGKIVFNGVSGNENLPAGITIGTLEIANTSGVSTSSGTLTIANSLVLTNGVITTTTSNILHLANSVTISGTPSSSKMISGPLQREFTATGSFVYPIGLISNGYKPVTFNYTAGTFGGTSIIEVAFSSSGVTPGTLPSGIAGIQSPEHYTIVERGTAPAGLGYSITATYENGNFTPETRNRVLVGTTGSWTVGTTDPGTDINTTDNTVFASGFSIALTTQRNIVFGSGGTINYWTNGGGDNLWFNDNNWSGAIPTSTDDVVIDATHGDTSPEVSIVLSGTNDAEALTLAIRNNCLVTAGAGTKQLKIYGTTGTSLTVESGATLVVTRSGNVITFTDAGDYDPDYTDFQNGSTFRRTSGVVKADQYYNLDLAGATGTGTSGTDAYVKGALTVSTANVTSGKIVLNGTAPQTISASSASLYDLQINNSTGVTLSSAVTLTNQLTLTSGLVNTTNTNLLTVAVTSGGSTTSYVNGPLAISGSTAKSYPIGKGGYFRPIYVTGTNATTTFELFNGNTGGSGTPPFRISILRYWVGSGGGINSNTQLQLSYVTAEDGVDTRATVVVAGCATLAGTYSDLGGGSSGSNVLGIASTSLSSTPLSVVSDPAYFTLGTSSTTDNPLPVELTSFDGTSTENGFALTWKTGSEKDSRGFILSRSVAGSESWSTVSSYATNSALKAINSLSGASYSFSDGFEMLPGDKFEYKLEEEDLTGTRVVLQILTVESKHNTTIKSFALGQNYPNPFNPTTTITYNVKQAAKVTIELFNLLGQKVKTLVNKQMERGSYQVQLNASDLTSGVYFYRMAATSASGNFVESKKLVLLK